MRNYTINGFKSLTMAALLSVFLFNAELFAIDENNWAKPLKRCWNLPNPSDNNYTVASDNDFNLSSIVFSSNSILNINLLDGSIIWETKVGSKILSKPILSDEKIYFLTEGTIIENTGKSNTTTLNSIDIKSGLLIWKKILSQNSIANLILNEQKVLILSDNNNISSILLKTGEIEWTKQLNETVVEILSSDTKNTDISLRLSSNKILFVSSNNGEIIGELTPRTKISKFTNINNQEIIWVNEKGDISSFNLKYKKVIWQRKIGGEISNISFYKDIVYISSLDNFVYLFDSKNGKLLLRKRLDGRITNKPALMENILAVSSYNSQTIWIFDLKTKLNVNQLSLSDADLFVESFGFAQKYLVITTPNSITAFSFDC